MLADVAVSAALNLDYPSLNLAQAVLLLAWEWRVAALFDLGSASQSDDFDEKSSADKGT